MELAEYKRLYGGRVEFIEAFGITQAELDTFKDTKHTAEELIKHHRRTNPLLVTDLSRKTLGRRL